MALTTADRNRLLTGGEGDAALKLAASEIPFFGSALDLNAAGFAERITSSTAGQPFAGFSTGRVLAKDHPTTPAAGDIIVPAKRGLFFARLPLTGLTQADAIDQRAVFAQDDDTFSFVATGTLVGVVWEIESTTVAIVLCASAGHHGALGLAHRGVKVLPATATQTLTTGDAGKLIELTSTAAQQVNLPDPAKVAGKQFILKKTGGGTFTVTLVPAAGLIDGAANNASITANNKTVVVTSDGTGYWITSAF